jgi:hypothetical protein
MGGGIGVETGVGFYLFCVLCFHVFCACLCVCVVGTTMRWVFYCAKNILGIFVGHFC